jgi:hypothetical protein
MKQFNVFWEEFDTPAKGVKPRWRLVEFHRVVEAKDVMEAVSRVKHNLGSWHIERFKCKNFKALGVK